MPLHSPSAEPHSSFIMPTTSAPLAMQWPTAVGADNRIRVGEVLTHAHRIGFLPVYRWVKPGICPFMISAWPALESADGFIWR